MTRTSAGLLVLTIHCAATARAQDLPAGDGLSLTQAIAVALAREPATRAARADVEAAQGMRLQAGLRANPTISFERRAEPGGTDSFNEAAIEWPLDLFRRGARLAAADADVRVAQHEEAEVRRQLAADVAAAYGRVAAAARVLTITDKVLEAATSQLELLRARAAQGSAPTLDRDIVEVDVRRIQAERMAQAGRVDLELLRLRRLLGMAPEAPLRVTQSLEELVAFRIGVAGVDPPSTRPDVRAADARVLAADARIDRAQGDARPELTVFGSYMRMDAGFPQRGFGVQGGLERVRGQFHYLSAGAMVTVPLWNRQQGAIAEATAARESAAARAESARLTAAVDVAEARVRDDQARRAVALYQDGIRPLASQNLETVRETYRLGRATVFDALTEQRRYLETERAYTDALSEAYSARISLGLAKGDIR